MIEDPRKCIYQGVCCYRNQFGKCNILKDTWSHDGRCHFRKEDPEGPNLYDEENKRFRINRVEPTNRRRRIAEMHLQGKSVQEISKVTGLSERTVERHLTLLGV